MDFDINISWADSYCYIIDWWNQSMTWSVESELENAIRYHLD